MPTIGTNIRLSFRTPKIANEIDIVIKYLKKIKNKNNAN